MQDEIDRLHNETDVSIQPSPVKSGGKSNASLQMRVKELELEVRRLKKVTRFTSGTQVAVTVLVSRAVLWIGRRSGR
jgi:hypothetical protein